VPTAFREAGSLLEYMTSPVVCIAARELIATTGPHKAAASPNTPAAVACVASATVISVADNSFSKIKASLPGASLLPGTHGVAM